MFRSRRSTCRARSSTLHLRLKQPGSALYPENTLRTMSGRWVRTRRMPRVQKRSKTLRVCLRGRGKGGRYSQVRPSSTLYCATKQLTRDRSAPKITTRHIVLSAHAVEPSKDVPETEDMSWSTGQNPPRPSYPKEVLKHRFMPYGSLAPAQDGPASMDVDTPSESPKSKKTKKAEEESPSKSKRRKTEGGETKKSKKAKTAEE